MVTWSTFSFITWFALGIFTTSSVFTAGRAKLFVLWFSRGVRRCWWLILVGVPVIISSGGGATGGATTAVKVGFSHVVNNNVCQVFGIDNLRELGDEGVGVVGAVTCGCRRIRYVNNVNIMIIGFSRELSCRPTERRRVTSRRFWRESRFTRAASTNTTTTTTSAVCLCVGRIIGVLRVRIEQAWRNERPRRVGFFVGFQPRRNSFMSLLFSGSEGGTTLWKRRRKFNVVTFFLPNVSRLLNTHSDTPLWLAYYRKSAYESAVAPYSGERAEP